MQKEKNPSWGLWFGLKNTEHHRGQLSSQKINREIEREHVFLALA